LKKKKQKEKKRSKKEKRKRSNDDGMFIEENLDCFSQRLVGDPHLKQKI